MPSTRTPHQNYQYMFCRSIPGVHHWIEDEDAELPIQHGGARGKAVGISMVCQTCGMEKDVWFSFAGRVVRTTYRQPKGYSLQDVTKADLRAEDLLIRERNIKATKRVDEVAAKRKTRQATA